MDAYQMWAHGMFPKGDFAHTVQRVETVCTTRRMEVGRRAQRGGVAGQGVAVTIDTS